MFWSSWTWREAFDDEGSHRAPPWRTSVAWLVLLVLLAAAPAGAQAPDGRIDAGVGLRWFGAIPFDRVSARETSLGNGHLILFDSDSELRSATGLEARIGVRLTSVLGLDGALSFSRPSLRTRITSDFEGASDITVSEKIAQYIVEAGLTARVARWRVGRLVPFASAGGGYLRQLHDDRQLVETGQIYYVGGGFRYPLTQQRRGLVTSAGIRGDVRATFLKDGVVLDDGTHTVPSLSASLFVTF